MKIDDIVKILIEWVFKQNFTIQLLFITIVGPVGYFTWKFINNKEFRADVILLISKAVFFDKNNFDKNLAKRHELFHSKSMFYRYISNITFENEPDKEWLFDTILETKIDAVIEKTKYFIDNVPIESKYPVLFEAQINDLLDDMTNTYEAMILGKYVIRYGEDCGMELFDYVYEKGFKPYHNANIDHIFKSIYVIAHSGFNVNYKIFSVNLNFYVALDQAISDCKKKFDDFNGGIKRIIEKYHTYSYEN